LLFALNRFPGTIIVPLRFAAGSLLLVFFLGSDFEQTNTFSLMIRRRTPNPLPFSFGFFENQSLY